MKAIILAAGRGSRLQSLTDNQPKCRVKLHGKQLIEWQIESLNSAGIKNLAIVRGYMADNFKYNFQYFDNVLWHKTNMVVSLTKASEWLKKNICIISYSDIIYSSHAVQKLIDSDADISIAYDPNWIKLWKKRFKDPLSDAETFKIKNGRILEIGEKTSNIDDIEGQYMGLFKITPQGWENITSFLGMLTFDEIAKLDITDMLNRLILSGINVTGIPISDNWYEVDTEEDLNYYKSIKSLW
jgi:choline kinase